MSNNPFVYIIVLSFNKWEDTILCLKSIINVAYKPFKVILVDNGSINDSIDNLKKWLQNNQFELVEKYTDDNIDISEYKRILTEIVLLEQKPNIGFAGGNNVGIKYAMKQSDMEYMWLLNNDTEVMEESLNILIDRVYKDPRIGICGSTLLYYDNPNIVQGLGGAKYNKWLGISHHFGIGKDIKSCSTFFKYPDLIEQSMDYVIGASMLVSRDFVKEVGLMCEDYFLYFEELDWIIRGKRKNYKIAWASQSYVLHKEGATIGTAGNNPIAKSKMSDYWVIRNRLFFTYKFYPYALPTVYLGLIISIINRIRRGQKDRIMDILKLMFKFNTKPKNNI